MERDTSGNQLGHIIGDFNPLLELMADETHFLQFIDLIRGESSDPIVKFCPNFDCEHVSGCLVDKEFESTQVNPFDFRTESMSIMNSDLINKVQLATDAEEETDNQEESSTTTTRTPPTKRKGDRSRTLVSERRRRGRMKEKLYALRALVPNITKMDKASIIGDALLYLQDLQTQAKKLRSEIEGLESSLGGREKNQQQGILGNRKNNQSKNTNHPIRKNIFQMDMFQVEERGFYARVECNRGQGVAPSLYKALESLTKLNVPSSNLGTLAERFILTFNVKVKECEPDMNLQNLKLGLNEAFLKQGFVLQTLASA